MKGQLKNKIRASALLLVFSLNTIAGFACSVGVDMGYNHNHHRHEKLHSRTDVKKHTCQGVHDDDFRTKLRNRSTKNDCCSNDVTHFTLLDKSVTQNDLNSQAPVFLLASTTTFLSQPINESGLAENTRFQFVRRSNFLNDTDIQTAISRYQI